MGCWGGGKGDNIYLLRETPNNTTLIFIATLNNNSLTTRYIYFDLPLLYNKQSNMKGKLAGLTLKVNTISRKGIEGADMVYCCDNCGKTIVNYATVTDGNKSYIIGLDCKKTLIDKEILAGLTSTDYVKKYEAKQYRAELNNISKFLLESSREGVYIDANIKDNWLRVVNPNLPNIYGTMGVTTYSENLSYLIAKGLGDHINKLINNSLVTM